MATRLKVRDFGTSLSFTSTNGLTTTYTPSLTAFSVAFWVKINSHTANARYVDWQDAGPANGFTFVNDSVKIGQIKFLAADLTIFSGVLPTNKWVHVVGTHSHKGSSTSKIYVNGVLIQTLGSGALMVTAAATLKVGNRATGTGNPALASMDEVLMYDKELTQAEITALYFQGTIPSSPKVYYKFDEGAGLVANDSSSNRNTGTITGATYSSDVPMKPRKVVNANLVKNGDFEFAPPFTALPTTNTRWIDGTAAGSTTNNLFGFAIDYSGTVSARFDPSTFYRGASSMRISTTATASWLEVSSVRGTPSAATLQVDGIRLSPNVAYTCTYRMKTRYVSGDATNGAALIIQQYNSAATLVASTISTYTKTTTDWTEYTLNFTANAATNFCRIQMRLYGHQGTATLIMDAWFDDIELKPTTAVARTSAGNRQKVRDFGTGLSFDGSTSRVVPTVITGLSSGFSMSAYFNVANTQTNQNIFCNTENTNNRAVLGINLGLLRGAFYDGASFLGPKSTNVFDKRWYHVVYTFNGTVGVLYLNGSSNSTGTDSPSTSATAGLNIGRNTDASRYVLGTIDEPRIWNRALTTQEVSDLYYKGTVPTSGLVGEWLFNEGSGSTAFDSSGNRNNGTITGATYTTDVPIISRTSL